MCLRYLSRPGALSAGLTTGLRTGLRTGSVGVRELSTKESGGTLGLAQGVLQQNAQVSPEERAVCPGVSRRAVLSPGPRDVCVCVCVWVIIRTPPPPTPPCAETSLRRVPGLALATAASQRRDSSLCYEQDMSTREDMSPCWDPSRWLLVGTGTGEYQWC